VVSVPIEVIRLGDQVATWQKDELGYEGCRMRPGTRFSPTTHRVVRLRQERVDGNWTEADLLRTED
jgi:hypothetical protein